MSGYSHQDKSVHHVLADSCSLWWTGRSQHCQLWHHNAHSIVGSIQLNIYNKICNIVVLLCNCMKSNSLQCYSIVQSTTVSSHLQLLTPVMLPSEHDICPSSLWAAAWCQDTASGPPPRRCTPSDSTFSAQNWLGWRPASWLEPQLVTLLCEHKTE